MQTFLCLLVAFLFLISSVEITFTKEEKPPIIDKQELKRERRRKNKLKEKNYYTKVQGKAMKYNHAKGVNKR